MNRNESIKEKYEKYWSKQSEINFLGYERNKVLADVISNYNPCRILDIGAGSGIVSSFLVERDFDVFAMDISAIACKKIKDNAPKTKILVASVDGLQLPFKNETFKIVFLGDILEHLYNPLELLKEAYKVLCKDGDLILSVPNMASWRYRFQYLFGGNIPKTEGSENPHYKWEHIRFFNDKVVKNILTEANFHVKNIHGVPDRKLDKLFVYINKNLFSTILIAEACKRRDNET